MSAGMTGRAMRALYLQELRKLWPIGLLGALLCSGDLLYRPFTELLDQMRWESIASYLSSTEADSMGWVLILLTWTAAYSAFIREQDERTLEVLLALPVRRFTIFWAKVSAGLTVLFAVLFGLACSDGWMGSRSVDSIEGGHFSLAIAGAHLAAQLGFVFIVYCHGLLASVFRRLGILPYALLLVVASILDDIVPTVTWVDPSSLLVVRYEGVSPSLPWLAFAVHGAFAALALAAAYGAWLGPASRVTEGFARARFGWAARLGCGCGGLVIAVSLAGLAALVSDFGEDSGDTSGPRANHEAQETPSLETRREVSERYEFVYPVSHEERAQALIADADALHLAVQRILGADAGPLIVADLSEQSREHRGISSWTHVRVGLAAETDPVRLRHVFTHETVHAFQHRLSDDHQGSESRATRWFGEGSAEWVAHRVVGLDEARTHARRMATAAWHFHGLGFDDLVDDERLRARFDTSLVYSLGELLVDSLVAACGESAIGDALRAMARDDAPDRLAPRAFWAATLGSFDCDLERVEATFESRLQREYVAQREAIDALPRLGAGALEGGRVSVVAQGVVPEGATVLARVRRGPEDSDSSVMGVRATPTAPGRYELRVPRGALGVGRYQIALGLQTTPDGWLWSEPWQWISEP